MIATQRYDRYRRSVRVVRARGQLLEAGIVQLGTGAGMAEHVVKASSEASFPCARSAAHDSSNRHPPTHTHTHTHVRVR